MNEISAKFKRQLEILGIAIRNTESVGTGDLARLHGVERLTIKRDLQDLRKHGIDIHSAGKRGVRLARKLGESRMQRLVSSYLALCIVGSPTDKASSMLVKKLGDSALAIIVELQRCMELNRQAKVLYASEGGRKPVEFVIDPLQIFQAGGLWRLLASHDNTLKQFLLTKVLGVSIGEPFRRVPEEEIDQVFRYSFESWTGKEEHKVRLRVSPEHAARLQFRALIGFEVICTEPDGWQILEGTVNSLDEMARWVVGQGGEVEVMAPSSLRSTVIPIALECLKLYQ